MGIFHKRKLEDTRQSYRLATLEQRRNPVLDYTTAGLGCRRTAEIGRRGLAWGPKYTLVSIFLIKRNEALLRPSCSSVLFG